MSAFETMMMAKKSGKIKTFVEEGLEGLTEAVVDELEEFLIRNISQYDLTLPAKQIQIIRNSTWLPKMSVLKLEWFLPCLTYQMPSEIRKRCSNVSIFFEIKISI